MFFTLNCTLPFLVFSPSAACFAKLFTEGGTNSNGARMRTMDFFLQRRGGFNPFIVAFPPSRAEFSLMGLFLSVCFSRGIFLSYILPSSLKRRSPNFCPVTFQLGRGTSALLHSSLSKTRVPNGAISLISCPALIKNTSGRFCFGKYMVLSA